MTHVGNGAIAVVGHDLDEDTDAMRAVGLIDDTDKVAALDFACAALDGFLDVVLGHIGYFGIGHGQP